MVTKQRLTVDEYLALPEEPPYLEYVEGEVIEKAIPDENHMTLIQELAFLIGSYRRGHGGFSGPEGRSAFWINGIPSFRLPDYSYFAPGRPRRDRGFLAAPGLAVEVRSPEETMASQRRKCRWFREHGVEVCWLIDPVSRTVEVLEGDRDGVLEATRLRIAAAPGLVIDSSALFAVLPND